MMETPKTNFKQIVNPDYLGSYSLDSGLYSYFEKDAIIIKCESGIVTNQSGKQKKIIAQTNIGKPYILNATAQNLLKDITGSRYVEDWKNVPVTFYVLLNQSTPMGSKDVLRFRKNDKVPFSIEKPKLELNSDIFKQAKKAVDEGTVTLEQIKVKYNVTEEVQIALGL